MTTIAQMAGRVTMRRGLGDEAGTLEIVDRRGKAHAYVTTDAGLRVHVPFAPATERSPDPDNADWIALGRTGDRSSGDLVVTTWSLRVQS